MIEEIARENLEELLDWLRQKKTIQLKIAISNYGIYQRLFCCYFKIIRKCLGAVINNDKLIDTCFR